MQEVDVFRHEKETQKKALDYDNTDEFVTDSETVSE